MPEQPEGTGNVASPDSLTHGSSTHVNGLTYLPPGNIVSPSWPDSMSGGHHPIRIEYDKAIQEVNKRFMVDDTCPFATFTHAELETAKQKAVQEALEKMGIGKPIPEGGTLALAIATPTLGAVSVFWHTQVKNLSFPMNTAQIPFMPQDTCGGKIAEMRNSIVRQCIAMEDSNGEMNGGKPVKFHSIFWLDDDVIPSIWCVPILASHNRPIVSGVYFNKMDLYCEPLIFPGGAGGTTPFRPNQVFESWGWAQGLCLIQLDVYRHMLKEFGDEMGVDSFGSPAWYRTPERHVDEKRGVITNGGTEDFPFFQRANRLGYRCLVDCRPQAFGFHYNLKEKRGYPTEQWNQYRTGQNIIWPGLDGEPDTVWGEVK